MAHAKVKPSSENEHEDGFNVTCTIGRVVFGESGYSPHVAAMILIGQHGAEGVYHFPMEDGRMQEVQIAFIEPSAEDYGEKVD